MVQSEQLSLQLERLSLQSKGGRDILNIVDSLRSQGISQYVELPQIIVCTELTLRLDESEVSAEAHPPKVLRSTYVQEINELILVNRGCELPGTVNPLLVGEMFFIQCRPWEGLVQEYVASIQSSVRVTLLAALESVADKDTANRLRLRLLEPKIAQIEALVAAKLSELLAPHSKGHPITYNHYFTENIQKAQKARFESKLWTAIKGVRESSSSTHIKKDLISASSNELFWAIQESTQPDVESYASTMAIDMMEAYYKVALKRFIDEVSVHAVEQHLIQKLPDILSLDLICDLSDAEVQGLAEEGPEIAIQRARVNEKLQVLEEGLYQLAQLRS